MELYTLFQTQDPDNHTLLSGTYLFRPNKGVPPPPPGKINTRDFLDFFRIIAGNQKSYLNASEDEKIEFGTPKVGIRNYPEGFECQWYLIVLEGHQIQITFDTFELEQSEHCENDYLEIREAYFRDPNRTGIEVEYGEILEKPRCGSTKPRPIQSSGNMVWVHFKSDIVNTTYKGFKASVTPTGGTYIIDINVVTQ